MWDGVSGVGVEGVVWVRGDGERLGGLAWSEGGSGGRGAGRGGRGLEEKEEEEEAAKEEVLGQRA